MLGIEKIQQTPLGFSANRLMKMEEAFSVKQWLALKNLPEELEALHQLLGLNKESLCLAHWVEDANPSHTGHWGHIIEVVKRENKKLVINIQKRGYYGREKWTTCGFETPVELKDFRIKRGTTIRSRYNRHERPRIDCFAEIECGGMTMVLLARYDVMEHLFKLTITRERNVRTEDGREFPFDCAEAILRTAHRVDDPSHIKRGRWERVPQIDAPFNFTTRSLDAMLGEFPVCNAQSIDNFLLLAVDLDMAEVELPDLKKKGIIKAWAAVDPLLGTVKETSPLTYITFRDFADNCHRTIDGVKISTIFNAELGGCKDAAEVVKAMAPLTGKSRKDRGYRWFDEAVKEFSTYKDKRRAALKSNSTRAFSKLMQEYDFLSMDEKKYPRIAKAVKNGDLPIGAFFRKKEQYFLLNDNWELWEEMMKKHKDIAIEMAQHVAKRTTYEKDLMSYFYFILRALPAYLRRHTKKRWTCLPKLVNSSKELEPPKAGDEGITRERSALTPIVDNKNNTVVVPYASLAMGGSYGTTYCYSHTYNVISTGLGFNGNVAMADLEEKLNGRDDYGLMFYTLTGSAQGRGYPTFLIIFERLGSGTRVHFHRTHPSRSKQGDYNPIHNWTKVCYNWMVGNVPRDLIRYQQGDLVFVEDVKEREYPVEPVDAYDHHVFDTPVDFCPYSAKSKKENILGFIRINKATVLNHTEHESVAMEPGRYVIRQARSWEANPSGVWSLRID